MKTNFWIKKYKYKYYHKQLYRLNGVTNGNYMNFKIFGYLLKSLKSIFLFSAQLESARRVIRHFFKKSIKIIINIICNKSISEKSNGVRMGKGKGNIKEWISPINSGRYLFFLYNINLFQSLFILSKASKKFNFKTIIYKNSFIKSNKFLNNLYF